MNMCILVNLKKKLQKQEVLKISYFKEEKISELKIGELVTFIKSNKIKNLLIEDKCIDNTAKFKSMLKLLNGSVVKIIILYYDEEQKNIFFNGLDFLPSNNKGLYLVDLKRTNFPKYILNIYRKPSKKFICFSNDKENENTLYKKRTSGKSTPSLNREIKQNRLKDNCSLENDYHNTGNHFLKFKGGENIILGIGLDRKVYSTTYLYVLVNELLNGNISNVYFYEKEQSIINMNDIIKLNKNIVNYEKFSIIKEVIIEEKNLYVIDLGHIKTYKDLQEILKYNYKKLIVFTTDCLKVNESDEYIKMLRFLEKHNDVIFVNRKDIFDSKIQENINYISSKPIMKNIRKNKIIKEIDD